MLQQIFREVRAGAFGFDEIPYEDILISLKEIQENLVNQETPIDWSFVRLHLGRMTQLKKKADFFYDVFFYIFRLFDERRCRDFSVIADTFQLESFLFEYSSNSFRKAKMMTNYMKNNISCCEIDGLNFVAKLMRMPYKSNCLPYVSMYDVIQMHLVCIEDKILKHMLEYGVMYIPLSDHRSTWSHCRQRMVDLFDDTEKSMLLNLRAIYANVKELSPETRQRMLAVFRGVEVILKARVPDNDASNFGLCFRMAYETIPEPIITSKEIAAFLKLVLSSDTFIKAVCKDYEKLFPESLEPLAPRSLKFLSRCQVRQNLRQAGTFPCGILDLDIPCTLKNYIHCIVTEYTREQYNSYPD